MIVHPASLDVSRATLRTVTGRVSHARRYPGSRTYQRAVGPQRQALLVLRWLRDAIPIWHLVRDAGISQATAHSHLHEALADRAPTLAEAIAAAKASDGKHLCIDGALIPADRVATRKDDGRDLGVPPARGGDRSGKRERLGVNIQVITEHCGFPMWVSDGLPGSTHDITAARTLVLPHLYPHTAPNRLDRIDVLADEGCTGAGAGVRTPHKRSSKTSEGADPDGATCSRLVTSLRAIAEVANDRPSERWHALRRVSLDPAAVGTIAAAALTLLHLEHRSSCSPVGKPRRGPTSPSTTVNLPVYTDGSRLEPALDKGKVDTVVAAPPSSSLTKHDKVSGISNCFLPTLQGALVTVSPSHDFSAQPEARVAFLRSIDQGEPVEQVLGWINDPASGPDAFVDGNNGPDGGDPYMWGHVFWDASGGINHFGCQSQEVNAMLDQAVQSGDTVQYAQAGQAYGKTGCFLNLSYDKSWVVTQSWLSGVPRSQNLGANELNSSLLGIKK